MARKKKYQYVNETGDKRYAAVNVFARALQAVKNDHRSMILVANGTLELFVEALVRAKCKHAKRILDDDRTYPYSAKVIILHEKGVISDAAFNALDALRKLRNDAAHEPLFGMEAPPEKLLEFCESTIGAFWNENFEIFAPIFHR